MFCDKLTPLKFDDLLSQNYYLVKQYIYVPKNLLLFSPGIDLSKKYFQNKHTLEMQRFYRILNLNYLSVLK